MGGYHVHGLENLILLRWQYSPNSPVDSVKSVSKPRLAFLEKLTSWSPNSYDNLTDPR